MLMEILPLVRQGYCCSQILVLLILRAQGEENPGLVRAMNGLCHGLGEAGGVCGLLTGGAAALGYLTGKGAADEEPHPMAQPLVNEFATWFIEEAAAKYGGCACPQIIGEEGAPSMEVCGDIMSGTWGKMVELLEAYGIDPTRPK